MFDIQSDLLTEVRCLLRVGAFEMLKAKIEAQESLMRIRNTDHPVYTLIPLRRQGSASRKKCSLRQSFKLRTLKLLVHPALDEVAVRFSAVILKP